ncbi:hypothetical protein PFLUV_G00054750 [Perca fluviatilis]|uniref:Ig-like domain-containing protein n=1 Tax=Perca fluviatilis TaxID=8168 RepID=A0A6A5FIJ8_PERFL|nr:uncharacterized protein LOC120558412 [Perca fluviatilis]KAF1390114.1 hypothetical protein PFLUV_G00054750 [Perca fluviatilis]
MSQKVLLIKLLLVHYATQEMQTANCDEDVVLKCERPGVDIDTVDYLSVAWYKFNNQKKKNGIIRMSKDNNTPQYYSFPRSPQPSFGEKHSLLLPRVTPEDSGTYECHISANVGSQNQDLSVNLMVHACATQADLTTMTTVLNTTQSAAVCHRQVEDMPVMWSIIVYVAVGLSKIVLALISIWVIEAVRMRSSRRWQH